MAHLLLIDDEPVLIPEQVRRMPTEAEARDAVVVGDERAGGTSEAAAVGGRGAAAIVRGARPGLGHAERGPA